MFARNFILTMKKLLWIGLCAAFLCVGCDKEPLTEFNFLVKVGPARDLTKKELMAALKINKPALEILLPDRPVRAVSITYRTTDPNDPDKQILASGLVTYPISLPDFQQRGAVLGVHYTIGSNNQAPSVAGVSHESLFSLLGYVVVAPDYVGYGASVETPHPYHHYGWTGGASVDMLFAAKEYFASVNRRFPRTLNVAGYSEGGYAAVACLKYIQEHYSGWFSMGEVWAGAGAYDMAGTYEEFIKPGSYTSQAGTVPMVLLGLNFGDQLGLTPEKMFKGTLLQHYDEWIVRKKYTTDEISAKIGSTDVRDFLAPEVFDKNDPGTQRLYASLQKTSLIEGWKPAIKLFLLHGNKDTIVPYSNSEKAYKKYQSLGCDVTLVPIEGKDHKEAGNDFYTFCLLRALLGVEHTQLAELQEQLTTDWDTDYSGEGSFNLPL